MFVIVPDGHDSLLGDKACEKLGLVKRVYSVVAIVGQYSGVFKGFGVLTCSYKIQLKDDAQPVVHASRRVPVSQQDELKKLA